MERKYILNNAKERNGEIIVTFFEGGANEPLRKGKYSACTCRPDAAIEGFLLDVVSFNGLFHVNREIPFGKTDLCLVKDKARAARLLWMGAYYPPEGVEGLALEAWEEFDRLLAGIACRWVRTGNLHLLTLDIEAFNALSEDVHKVFPKMSPYRACNRACVSPESIYGIISMDGNTTDIGRLDSPWALETWVRADSIRKLWMSETSHKADAKYGLTRCREFDRLIAHIASVHGGIGMWGTSFTDISAFLAFDSESRELYKKASLPKTAIYIHMAQVSIFNDWVAFLCDKGMFLGKRACYDNKGVYDNSGKTAIFLTTDPDEGYILFDFFANGILPEKRPDIEWVNLVDIPGYEVAMKWYESGGAK